MRALSRQKAKGGGRRSLQCREVRGLQCRLILPSSGRPRGAQQSIGYRLGVLLCALSIVRLVFAWMFFGFHSGDDVEILQEAFRRALGWEYAAWNIRNLLFSELAIAPAVAIGHALGITSVRPLTFVATIPVILLATLNVWLVFALVERRLHATQAAWWGAFLYGLHWLPLGFGSTVYPRTASTAAILAAAFLVWRDGARWSHHVAAGALLALAWAIRYSEVIFLIPLIYVAARSISGRRGRIEAAGWIAGGFVAGSLLTIGLADWITWGRPFGSLFAFGKYTILERQSSSLHAVQPFYWYLARLGKWLPLALLPLMWSARSSARARDAASFVIVPLILLSVVHHKELRYLQGIIPFLMILAAAGAWELYQNGRRSLVAVLLGASILLGLPGLTFLLKKSMPAVNAAQDWTAQDRAGGAICASQRWAYGGTLYTHRYPPIVDLPFPLTGSALRKEIGRCRVVALYEKDLLEDTAIAHALSAAGFRQERRYEWGRAKAVLVYRMGSQEAR